MNKILITLLILVPGLIKAQTIEKSNIVGTWTVIEGKTTSAKLPPDVNQMMLMMIEGFKGTTWIFQENGVFRLKLKQNPAPIMEEMKFLDNKRWKLDRSLKQIRVGTKEDNYHHLVLNVEQVSAGMKVYFSDTPIFLILRVNK